MKDAIMHEDSYIYEEGEIVKMLNLMSLAIYEGNRERGFWDKEAGAEWVTEEKSSKIALMHSELSEALEAIRKEKKDDHLPEFDGEVVELADTIIRILDYCGRYRLPIGEAVIAKLKYNATRPYKHGKKF